MRFVRFVCLFVILGSAMLAAQFNTVTLVNQPATSKVFGSLSKTDPATQGKIVQSYDKLPLSFEENQGQTDSRVKFLSRGSGYTLFLTGDEAVFSLRGRKANGAALPASPQLQRTVVPTANAVLRMKLRNANYAVRVTGVDQLPGKSNYFIGNDPKKWRTNVATYARVKYRNVYRGIDLVYYGKQGQLEYDFVVAPGADPRRIQFDVSGAKSISLDEHGELLLQTDSGEIRWHKPIAYQEKGGRKEETAVHYAIKNRNRVGFYVSSYDSRKPLIVDPALAYSTYLGGSRNDVPSSIAVDASGNAYVTGQTVSSDFPTTPGAFQTSCGGTCGQGVAFITKLNPTSSALVYSTYLNGSTSSSSGSGIAVDSSGDAYVTGSTSSTDFPVTPGVFQMNYGGEEDAFVTELNSTGSALVYSTYLGGSNTELGGKIAVDTSGNAFVIGTTYSPDFPTTSGAFQTTCGAGCGRTTDAFVSELNPTGTVLVYSTFLGGSSYENGFGIAVDSSGNAYVSGETFSTDFPTTPGAFQTACSGGCASSDAFVTELNSTGSALIYSTYLGGSSADIASSIAVDAAGAAYVTGVTDSTDFPTTPGAFQIICEGGGPNCVDAFVSKLNTGGSALIYSTYLGGSGGSSANGIAVNTSGNAYLTGGAGPDFPVTPGAFQMNSHDVDAFVTELNSTGSALIYSTYLGGSNYDYGIGVALDSSTNPYVIGATTSLDFPVTPGAFQTTCGGGCNVYDAFVTKFVPGDQVWPLSLDFGNQNVGTKSSPQNSTLTNSGTSTLSITSIKITGANPRDFAETNNCVTSLPAGGSCKISVTFSPKATGNRSAVVTVVDDAPNSPQKVSVSGVGTQAAVTFSPKSLTFPTQVVFTSSAARPVTLTNTGNGMLLITRISVSGPFGQTNNCPDSLDPGTKCTISVKFHPKTKGVQQGEVSVTDNAPDSPQKVPLTGTGTYVQLLPTKLNFGTQPVGTRSLAKKITLTNKGSVTVNISGIAITGADAGDFAETNTCGKSVASGASCFIKVTFKPLVKGKRTADVSVYDDGGGSPQKVALIGTGT